jgi:uncharacterized protein with FMN-binding domain
MRRTAAVVLGTVTGTALLVGAKLGTAAPGDSGDGAESAAVISGPTAAPHPSTSAPTTRASAKPSTSHTTAKPAKTTAKPTPTGPKDGKYTAKSAVKSGRYGTLTMTVTISGQRITAVAASEDGGESRCYHSACPKLTSEALTAQSASVATVSGATYTSDAYRSALAAVLKSANG